MHILFGLIVLIAQNAASIQGTVLKRASDSVLSKATIELKNVGDGESLVAITNDEGRFALRNIPPGKYRLTASRPGFVRTETTVVIGPGQDLAGIRLEMQPTGTIHGLVHDRDGRPLVNATVHALKATYHDGARSLMIEQSAVTNDLGEYRLFWLEPGEYFVSANPAGARTPPGLSSPAPAPRGSGNGITGTMSYFGNMVVRRSARREEPQTYAPTYYPGTVMDQAAKPIDVTAGADVEVDIDVVTEMGHTIRGVIQTASGPAQYAQLRIAQSPSFLNNVSFVIVNPDTGAFSIEGVIPGSYVLLANANRLSGKVAVTVDNTDVDNVVIRLTPGFDVSGRVSFDGARENGLRVRLVPQPVIPDLHVDSNAIDDNSFVVNQVAPDDYRVSVLGLSDNAYVKSIRLASTDLVNSVLHLDRKPEAPLEIVIGTNAGRIEGRVEGAQNVTVALVPEASLRSRSELYKATIADETGRFRLAGISPGDYKIFAWERVVDGAWQNSDFIGAFEDLGTSIQIREGSSLNVVLNAIPSKY